MQSDMAISPDGDRIYVTNIADSTVTVMNTQTGVIEQTITVPKNIVGQGAPYRIAFSPEGDHVYVVDQQGKVSEISFADTAINV
jgi:YVTN family beta-propeller protein